LVLIGSIATYSAYLWLVKYAPVGLIATYAYVNPVIAVTIGAIVLNEKLSTTLLIGAAVVITGVVMVVRAESRAVATQVQPSA
jgi:drug/metabolite transporter (DMT)-like permease